MAPVVVVEFAIKTVSEANVRTHWSVRARRAKAQRTAACYHLLAARLLAHWEYDGDGPFVIHLTRLSPRKLDDDNLRGALKAVRDGVADYLGIDDGDDRLTWGYGQERAKVQGVRIEVGS